MTRGWITGLGEESAHAAILGLLGLQTTIRLHVVSRCPSKKGKTYIDAMLETVELHHVSNRLTKGWSTVLVENNRPEKRGHVVFFTSQAEFPIWQPACPT